MGSTPTLDDCANCRGNFGEDNARGDSSCANFANNKFGWPRQASGLPGNASITVAGMCWKCIYEWAKRTKFMLAVIYASCRRDSNISKPLKKIGKN